MTTPPRSRLLHEFGGTRVHHRPGRTDWTPVTFGPRQAHLAEDRWWGAGLGWREGLDVVRVATTAARQSIEAGPADDRLRNALQEAAP